MNMADSFRDSDVTLSDAEDDGDNIGLLPKGQRFRGQRSTRRRVCFFFQSRPVLSTLCVTAVLVATNILTWHAATRITRHSVAGNVAEPPKIARVIRELDVTQTHRTKYDSTFYNYGNPFRGPPGPETDAVWENDAGAAFGFLLIPTDQAEETGLSMDHLHFDGKDDHAGLEGFPVNLEVFHQIHCLNLIRMATFYNADYYKKQKKLAFSHPENQLIAHVDHCIDNIRQRLMCTVDVGLIPFRWVNESGRIGTDPDFRQPHTCRDFSKLHEFMKANMQDMPENRTLMPRPGDFVVDHFT